MTDWSSLKQMNFWRIFYGVRHCKGTALDTFSDTSCRFGEYHLQRIQIRFHTVNTEWQHVENICRNFMIIIYSPMQWNEICPRNVLFGIKRHQLSHRRDIEIAELKRLPYSNGIIFIFKAFIHRILQNTFEICVWIEIKRKWHISVSKERIWTNFEIQHTIHSTSNRCVYNNGFGILIDSVLPSIQCIKCIILLRSTFNFDIDWDVIHKIFLIRSCWCWTIRFSIIDTNFFLLAL